MEQKIIAIKQRKMFINLLLGDRVVKGLSIGVVGNFLFESPTVHNQTTVNQTKKQ